MIAAALLGVALAAASPPNPFPRAAASYLVEIDGRVAWEKAATSPRLPASLSKLMTALVLVDDAGWDPQATVTISERAAKATGSRAGLRSGDRVTAADLLAAMLVASSNDACAALAEYSAGSTGDFARVMNTRAETMGLSGTHFANPCGHDAPGQRSTARDLLALTKAAMAHDTIARNVALRAVTLSTAQGRKISLKSGNHLLGSTPGVIGVKTGYTPGAGKCLIVAAERNGVRVVIVLLDAVDRWWTAAALIEEAFDAARSARK